MIIKVYKDLLGTIFGQLSYYITIILAAKEIPPDEYSEFGKFVYLIGFLTVFSHCRLDWLLPQTKDYKINYIDYKNITILALPVIFVFTSFYTNSPILYSLAILFFSRNEIAISYHIRKGDYYKLSYIKSIQFLVFFFVFFISSQTINWLIGSYVIGLMFSSLLYELYSPTNKFNILRLKEIVKGIDINLMIISLMSRFGILFFIYLIEKKYDSYELGIYSFIILTFCTPLSVINASLSKALWSDIVNKSKKLNKKYFGTFGLMSILYIILTIGYFEFFELTMQLLGENWNVSLEKLFVILISLYPMVVGSSLNQYLGLGKYKYQYISEILRFFGFIVFLLIDIVDILIFYKYVFLLNLTILVLNLTIHYYLLNNQERLN